MLLSGHHQKIEDWKNEHGVDGQLGQFCRREGVSPQGVARTVRAMGSVRGGDMP